MPPTSRDPVYRDPGQPIETRVADLLGRMTPAEKLGQLNQLPPKEPDLDAQIVAGRVGSVILAESAWAGNERQANVFAARTDARQRLAVERSRLGIPLLFGRDVIHGHRTVFPIGLGQAAGFDPQLVEDCMAVAAAEARREGVHWAFTPMLDICRDPRWGRIAEGYGEDPWLCGRLGAAAVRGLQGDLGPTRVAACAKHYVGYGAAEGGRDYDTADLGPITLSNVHLRPFRDAVAAGVCSVMSGFHEIDGVPISAHRQLLRGTLKEGMRWDGLVVSDYGAVWELQKHGVSGSRVESARLALEAGIDLEMCTRHYVEELPAELAAGRIDPALVDDACARVLRLKFRLGLFERPYASGAGSDGPTQATRALAHQAALRSAVLLQNRGGVLPLARERVVALVGAQELLEDGAWLFGTWTLDGIGAEVVPIGKALTERLPATTRHYLPDNALQSAMRNEVIVVVLGESPHRSGEAHCVSSLELPPGQIELLEALSALGKPIVAVVVSGRPLVLTRVARLADAVLQVFHPGIEGGNAIADILAGVHEPLGRLPASFPDRTGQIPVHYNRKRTGRPETPESRFHVGYIDGPMRPAFPFGHGLGFTSWAYADLRLVSVAADRLIVSVRATNTGARAGSTVVQCYLRDHVARITRPERELCGARRITAGPGETVTVEFAIESRSLGYWDATGAFRIDPGSFTIWAGADSRAALELAVDLPGAA